MAWGLQLIATKHERRGKLWVVLYAKGYGVLSALFIGSYYHLVGVNSLRCM